MDHKIIQYMERERDKCKDNAKWRKKELMLDPSFDTGYWTAHREIAEKEIEAVLLTRHIAIASMEGNTKDFGESEAGQRLLLQERSLKLDCKLYQAEAEKKFNFRRRYLELTIGPKSDVGIMNSRRQRDNFLQSAFRADLILKMDSHNPKSFHRSELWCPVTNMYWPPESGTAGHLFPWKCSEATMDAIFGRPDSGHSELFKAEKGILWSFGAQRRFEGGHFVIVPDVPNQPTRQQVDAWEASDPKEYKIRVLNPKHPLMKDEICHTNIKWAALDNHRLQFKTSFRPRARYLYFAYCEAMLRHSLMGNHPEFSSAELGTNFWGVPGRYMLEGMLLGFIKEMGQEYNYLLKGAIKEGGAVVDARAIAAANAHIQETLKADDDEDTDSDSESDFDDEEDTDDDEDLILSILFESFYFIF